MKSDMWTTKDGRQIPVVDMDDRHVLSTIRLLKRRSVILGLAIHEDAMSKRFNATNMKETERWIGIFVSEARRRKLDGWTAFGIKATETLDSE
jgi:hypothetical protein